MTGSGSRWVPLRCLETLLQQEIAIAVHHVAGHAARAERASARQMLAR